jgi:hypothetical protein
LGLWRSGFQWLASRRIFESVLSDFNGLPRNLRAKPPLNARRPRTPDLPEFLKNNSNHQAVWQEIVDFSDQVSWPSTKRFIRAGG